MVDALSRTLTVDGTVRGLAAVTTGVVEEARVRHGTLPTATAALGRALTAAILLAGAQKRDERLSLEFSGDGPLRGILVDATPDGDARGFVFRPRTHLPPRAGKLDVGGALGQGLLCVLRVPLAGGATYRSIVPLASGEIGADVATYLAQSEQTPSVLGVGVFVEPDGRVGAAGGYLFQAMPGADDRAIARLETNVGRAATPSELVRQGLDAAGILAHLLAGLVTRVLEGNDVRFRCRCSPERAAAATLAMGRDEIRDVLAQERRAEVTCEFCGARYVLEEAALRELLAGSGNGAA